MGASARSVERVGDEHALAGCGVAEGGVRTRENVCADHRCRGQVDCVVAPQRVVGRQLAGSLGELCINLNDVELLDQVEAKVERISVTELRDNTFYAVITVSVAGTEIEIDSRPSDAIALALKFAVPIFVSEDVMNEVAFVPDKEGEEEAGVEDELFKQSDTTEPEDRPKDPHTRKMNKLQGDLKSAIDSEDYEKAASIRDEIKRLELSR